MTIRFPRRRAALAATLAAGVVLPATAQAFYFPGWPGSGIPPPPSLTPPPPGTPPGTPPPDRPPSKPPGDPPPEVPEPATAVLGLIGLAVIGARRSRK